MWRYSNVLLVLLAGSPVGCAVSDVTSYESVDPSSQTVTLKPHLPPIRESDSKDRDFTHSSREAIAQVGHRQPETLYEQHLIEQSTDQEEAQWVSLVEKIESLSTDGKSEESFEPTVDLATLESIGLATHPEIRRYAAAVGVQQGARQQAGLHPNPTLQLQSEEIGNGDASGLHSVTYGHTWVTANKISLSQCVASAQIQKSRKELDAARLRVRTRIHFAYTEMLVAQHRVQITEHLKQLASQSVELVREMLKANEVSRIALLQSENELEQAEMQEENAVVNLDATRRKLAAAIGVETLPAPYVAGDLEESLPDIDWEDRLAELRAGSPQLEQADSERNRARRALALACAQAVPNVQTRLGIGYDGTTSDTYTSLEVGVALPIFNRNQGNIRSARSQVFSADAERQQSETELVGKFADAIRRYRTSRRRVERSRGAILRRAEETLQLSRKAFQAGEASFLELLTAQRALVRTQLNTLTAIEQARYAAAEIDGMLTATFQ